MTITMNKNWLSMTTLTTVLCFLYPATLLITAKSYSAVALVMGLISLIFLYKTKKNVTPHKEIKWVFLAMMSYYISIIASLVIYGGPNSQFDIPSRTLLIFPIIALLLTYRPSTKWVMLGVATGGIVSGVIASYMHFVLKAQALGQEWGHMYIQASGMAMTLGLLSVCTFFHFIREKQHSFALLSTLGGLGGIFASLLSGGRGAWVFAPIALCVVILLYRKYFSPKILIAFSLIVLVAITSGYQSVSSRLANAKKDIELWQDSSSEVESGGNSVGTRLELWKAALYVAQESPIFGAGYANIKHRKQLLVDEGLVNKLATDFIRAHNQYLEDLQTKGLIGLSAVLLMLTAPIAYFWKQYRKHRDTEYGDFALMGITHLVLLSGYFMTQSYLNHHSGILLYTTLTAMFIALSTPAIHSVNKQES